MADADPVIAQLREIALALAERYGDVRIDALAQDDDFARAVGLAMQVPADKLTELAQDKNPFVGCAVLFAVTERQDAPKHWERLVGNRLEEASPGEANALLRLLADEASRPVLLQTLAQVESSWLDEPVRSAAVAFVETRLRAGDRVTADQLEERIAPAQEPIVVALSQAGDPATCAPLVAVIREWRSSLVDTAFLQTVGRIIGPNELAKPKLVGGRAAALDAVETALGSSPPRSLLLVGEQGVGKSALVGEAVRRAGKDEWLVFQATASDVIAGQMYIGMLEGRVQEIVQRIRGRKVIWLLPGFEEAFWAGQHHQSPQGLLDALLPHVESGQIVVVGEIDPLAYELVAQLRPRVSRVFRVVRLAPMLEDEAVAVARDWADTAGVGVADGTIREALDLASHYLPGIAAPGSLIRILELAAERADRAGEAAVELRTIIATLGEATGLPLHVLDPRAQLDLGTVRSFFAERVLGQPSAVETLVERIALVKAGLTDPTRPLGVFLFVGPTGTGKTEIAKRLAEFLFGSVERLVRLDMSEFQTPESLERLLTDSTLEPQASPLIASVRKEPFSVVLLDEFEKAHANIWDVFLQVFDDGRLTDRSGRVVDFRHCVIVLTSNVGSAIPTRPGLGFGSTVESFDTTSIERAVARAFRPELLNRLDRVVVFRPLGREVMRTLVEHELAAVLERRGFRMHPWAVEWDESAIDFLLEQGFTADLGARPLKRAVEQQLLAPLATTIVERQFPEGEQFLFITARDGRINVTFVDPDAAEDEPASPGTAAAGTPDVRSLALDAEGSRAEVQFLAGELERVERRLAPVGEEKEAALARTREPGFWDGDEQTPMLARIEYLDRVEAALRTAVRLLSRLHQERESARRPNAEVVCVLAERLYLLDRVADEIESGDPPDAYVSVRPSPGVQDLAGDARDFAGRLLAMYERWAKRRGMRTQPIPAADRDERRLAISGFGAYTILKAEAGLHVLELPRENQGFARANVHVVVAPRTDASRTVEEIEEEAGRALSASPAPQTVVRRYRRAPSPLVRDASGWRTGRIDQVLAGDFDLRPARAGE